MSVNIIFLLSRVKSFGGNRVCALRMGLLEYAEVSSREFPFDFVQQNLFCIS